MPTYGERTGMFQVGGGEDNRISVVYGLVCRYSYKLVVAYQRAIFGRCDDIMGIYPQTLRFFGGLSADGFCLYVRYACRRFYLWRKYPDDPLDRCGAYNSRSYAYCEVRILVIIRYIFVKYIAY